MGGSDSTVEHHYHTIQYKTDPAIMAQLDKSMEQLAKLTDIVVKLQQDYRRALQEAQQLGDPTKYQEQKEKAFQMFVDNLHKLKFTEPIPRIDGHKYFVLIGNISSGKSSLINFACGTSLDVGLGEVTMVAQQVATDGLVHIYDSPGINQHFSIFKPQNLSYFLTADRVFILYPDSLKSCKQIVTVMHKIKPNNTYLVRTKCDMWDPTQVKTIKQEIQVDKAYLTKLNMKLPILATSSKKQLTFEDNNKFKRLFKRTLMIFLIYYLKIYFLFNFIQYIQVYKIYELNLIKIYNI